jgi:hypothetical protein
MYELRNPCIHSESRPTDWIFHIDTDTSLVLRETPTVHVRHSSDDGWPPAYRTAWHLGSHRGSRTVNMSRHAALLICGKMLREPSNAIPGLRHRRALPAYYSAFNVDTDGYLRSLNSSRCSIHRFRNLLPLSNHTFQVSMTSQALSAQRAERRSKLTAVSQSRQ